MKNKKGQTESVFKLALAVIIIAAVLAVVAFLMNSAWTGAENIGTSTDAASGTVADSTDCLTGAADCSAIGSGR